MYYQRLLNLDNIIHKSIFLFGPRQTGKSSLLHKRYSESIYYNLLLSDVFSRLSNSPQLLREEILAKKDAINGPIIIDEIQRIPSLLNEVHQLIEELNVKFILTGSSARKLKRGGGNLLGGRALTKKLLPLTTKELLDSSDSDFDLLKVINFGTLPSVYTSEIPKEELLAYVGTYLKEEIQAEGLVRRLEPFSQFLELAGVTNSEIVNFTKISNDLGVSSKTVREYYLILEDTLVGHLLSPYKKTLKRKPVATPKFYFFDVGVANILGKRKEIEIKTELFGKCFEHFIFTELKAYLEYNNDERELTFWRSKNKQEVDFVIGDDTAIEVKSTSMVQDRHLKGLKALSEEVSLKNKIIISLDLNPRLIDGKYLVLPVKEFLRKLWQGDF